ncbi:hypothetical protein V8E36_004980 [Tilletia maclaganii]
MKLNIVASLALAGAAVAQTDGPAGIGAAPAGFLKGVLNATINCNITALAILPLGSYKIPFGVSAKLPDKVAAGQPFSVVAGTRLIVPQSVNGLASLFGARFYGGKATKVIVNADGANPSSIDAAAGGGINIPQAPINSRGISVLEVPGNSGTLTVGPFTADAGSNVVLSFGEIKATVDTFNATGAKTFITAFVTCPAAQRPTSLAFVAVGKSGSTTPIVPNASGVGNIKTVPLDTTAGVVGVNYNCNFGDGLVVGTVRVSIGGVKPTNQPIASGGDITLTQGQANIYLTSSLISKITTITGDAANKINLTVKTVNILAKNATPSKKNVIPSGGITIKGVPLKAGAVITVPKGAPTNTLPDITFTAGESGTTALLSLGSTTGSASLIQPDGQELLEVDFVCNALSPATGLLPYDIA